MMMIGLDMAWMGTSAKLSNHVVSLTSDYFTDLSVGGQSKAEHIRGGEKFHGTPESPYINYPELKV